MRFMIKMIALAKHLNWEWVLIFFVSLFVWGVLVDLCSFFVCFIFACLLFWGFVIVLDFFVCCLVFGWFCFCFCFFIQFGLICPLVLSPIVLLYFQVLLTSMETILDNYLVPGLLSWWKDMSLSVAFSWNRLLIVTHTWLLSHFLLLPIVTHPGRKAQLCFGSVVCHWWTDLITD